MPIAPSLAGDTIFMGAAHIIISKPATKADWVYLWVEGDVTVELKRPELEVSVAGFGQVAGPSTDEIVEVTFTPANRIDAATLAYLYGSVFSAMPGASYFGAASTPVWIHTMAGRLLGLTNCRPTTFPSLNFGVGVKRFGGSITLTGILGRGLARTAANALFTPWAAETFTAAPDEADFPQFPCSATWAKIAGTVIEGMEAWTLTPQIALAPRTLGNLGTIDYSVGSVVLEASAVPANLAEANLWAEYALGASRALGKQVEGGDLTLAEDFGGITAVVKNAVWTNRPTRFDEAQPISGQCTWRSRRKAVDGAWAPAGTLAMTPDPEA